MSEQNPLYIAILYDISPEKFSFYITLDPEKLLVRQNLKTDKKLELGYIFRFERQDDCKDMLATAVAILRSRGQMKEGRWYVGAVSRAVYAMDLAKPAALKNRRRRLREGGVLQDICFDRIHPKKACFDAAH